MPNLVASGGSLYVDLDACIGARTARAKFEVNSGTTDTAAVGVFTTNTADDFLAVSGGRQNDQGPHIAWKRGPLRIGVATLTNTSDFSTLSLTERVRITETGAVGIGTTNTSGAKLVVEDSDSAALRINGVSGTYGLYLGADVNQPWIGSRTNHDLRVMTNSAERLRVTAGGNVGIGTTTPLANNRLDVNGDIAIRGKHAFRGSDTWLRLNQDGHFTSGVHCPGLFAPRGLNVGGAGSWGDPGSGNVWVTGRMGIGATNLGGAKLIIEDNADAALRINGGGGAYGLYLGADANHPWIGSRTDHDLRIITNSTERLRVTADGDVGIGTTSPRSGHRLDVNGDIAIRGKHAFRGNDNWLRLNQSGHFTSGVHCPGVFAPVGLNVGGAGGWGNPGSGNAWITGTLGVGTTDTSKGRLVVNGQLAINPGNLTSYPNWGNGVHTWDLYAEGTVGVGTDGAVNASMNRSGNGYFAGKVGIGGPVGSARLQVSGGAITPASGNSESAGILFPKNPGGGSGDAAWIRYYPRVGEATTFEIGTSNDSTDHIALMPSGNVGIGMNAPGVKLDVSGEIRASGIIRAVNGFRPSTNDWEIARDGEDLVIREPEQSNKEWARFRDDNGLYLTGTPNLVANGTISAGGNISYRRLTKLDVEESFTATVRAADFKLGYSTRRGSPGRAMVDYKTAAGNKQLRLNYGSDWNGVRYYGNWGPVSSRRYKENINTLEDKQALDLLDQLEPVSFTLKADESKELHFGFIAEDTPNPISDDEKETVLTDYIIAVLTRVLKVQRKDLSDLQGRLAKLEKKTKSARDKT